MTCFILHNVAKHLNDEDFAVDIPGDGEQEEIHNQHGADYADGVIRQREGSLLGPAFIVVGFSTGPELPDASSDLPSQLLENKKKLKASILVLVVSLAGNIKA
ncbi:unnamed protein product [Acanthoscelides obtectus]|uniref:Uncharacterized protein n=1 Tax=Acanthoscelides obtectus TaxID=200917 RepID=A0A9P0Q9W4_ACAOB|nr:unnamed protein product [Acanthoscelides obtectus]CAK1648800.1 hypothetical protein AOBTE_LOCUS15882 [Acanthoscelides obtectus]